METEQLARGLADASDLDARRAGPTVTRILLGGRLRRLREARGISREDGRRGDPRIAFQDLPFGAGADRV